MRRHSPMLLFSILLVFAGCTPVSGSAADGPFVVHVSVDGLRADAIERLGSERLPTFYRLRAESAWTGNARTDPDSTVTLPNHVGMLTGRTVAGPDGHGWTFNGLPAIDATLHDVFDGGDYLVSVFDVVAAAGLRSGIYTGKRKFSIFQQSYDDPLAAFVVNSDTETLVQTFLDDAARRPYDYAFLHLRDPDTAGHVDGFDPTPGTPYAAAVERVDRFLGDVLRFLEEDPDHAGRVHLVLTADHGGSGRGHYDRDDIDHIRIPFLVWGPTVDAGADLYALNAGVRADPGVGAPQRTESPPPIRNGESGNLALGLIGLEAIPGSTLNADRTLRFRAAGATYLPAPDSARATRMATRAP